MGKKILWLTVSAWMVLSLVVSACAQATTSTTSTPTTETTPTSTSTTQIPAQTTQTQVTTSVNVPKYGGNFDTSLTADPTHSDGAQNKSGGGALIELVYQQYMGGDWLRGPAGSGVMNLGAGAQAIEDNYGPQLAES